MLLTLLLTLVFILSDFRIGGWEKPLIRLAHKNDVIAVNLHDAFDEELADLIGVDKETFLATVARYNELADAGEDVDFYKDTVFLTPIKEGPFYATRVGAGLLAVVGGLHIDDNNQVMTAEDEVIPGLFAVGNVSGDMYAQDYPINFMGNSHGRWMVDGYCVGTYLANL